MANYSYQMIFTSERERFKRDLDAFKGVFNSPKFLDYLAEKCLEELRDICDYTLVDFMEHSVFDAKVQEYERSHKKKIGENYILIYNDTTLTQDEMFWVSPTTKQNYPDGLSISYVLEYGTGLLGVSQPDWETNANPNGLGHISTGEWFHYNPDYLDSDNKLEYLQRTSGIEGRFIYQKLADNFATKVIKWVDAFLDKEGY